MKPVPFQHPERNGRCWLCNRPLQDKQYHRHHVICRRYFGKDIPMDGRDSEANIALVHPNCHYFHHWINDDWRWSYDEFLKRMEAINFGKGVFSKNAKW